MIAARLEPGDIAPAFTLADQDGSTVSLTDFLGQKVVLYFYPEASTPGCTVEACDFRDNLGSLAAAGYQVLGVSKDELPELKVFQEEERLTFPLLSDPDQVAHDAYCVWGEKNLYGNVVTGTLRSTFVIDQDGRLEHALYNVKATGHVAMLRRLLELD
jgi:thioredoxin-dependent peroxiredoxin